MNVEKRYVSKPSYYRRKRGLVIRSWGDGTFQVLWRPVIHRYAQSRDSQGRFRSGKRRVVPGKRDICRYTPSEGVVKFAILYARYGTWGQSTTNVTEMAGKCGVHPATAYRWIKRPLFWMLIEELKEKAHNSQGEITDWILEGRYVVSTRWRKAA